MKEQIKTTRYLKKASQPLPHLECFSKYFVKKEKSTITIKKKQKKGLRKNVLKYD